MRPSEIIGDTLGKNKHMTDLSRTAISEYWASLKPNEQGLVPVVTTEASSNVVLMMAWMNETSLAATLKNGLMHYWSRSRQKFWLKGETSGHTQQVRRFHVDCDLDTLLFEVEQTGCACHTGHESCFFQEVDKQGLPVA
ncbi:MAG: hypothetical protein RLZZ240_782, partial [Actinomycetota bacterium]